MICTLVGIETTVVCPAIGFMKGYDCTLVGIEINIVMPNNKLYEEAFLNYFDA